MFTAGVFGRRVSAFTTGIAFYIFFRTSMASGSKVFRSRSIQGPWERNQLPGRHDLSVLFDDDGKIYMISGNRSPYPIEELTPEPERLCPGGAAPARGEDGRRPSLLQNPWQIRRCVSHPRWPSGTKWLRFPTRLMDRGKSSAWSRANPSA